MISMEGIPQMKYSLPATFYTPEKSYLGVRTFFQLHTGKSHIWGFAPLPRWRGKRGGGKKGRVSLISYF